MPYKSEAQRKFFFAAEARGDIKKGTARRWAHETPSMKKLPERVGKKKKKGHSKKEFGDALLQQYKSKQKK